MISSSCFSLVKINPTTQPTIVNASNSTSPHSPPLSNLQRPTSPNHNNRLPIQSTRRNLLNISILTIIASPISPFLSSTSTWAQTQESLALESYTDTNEGFTLLRPTPWTKVCSILLLLYSPHSRVCFFLFGLIHSVKLID